MSSPVPNQVTYTSPHAQTFQEAFRSQYDLASSDGPTHALNAYMRSIHRYTQSQLDSIQKPTPPNETKEQGGR
ncbi:MAG: hypothetical protein Q9196_003870, partial [Gyalolechia fulgens]